jgi:hypothetical protein
MAEGRFSFQNYNTIKSGQAQKATKETKHLSSLHNNGRSVLDNVFQIRDVLRQPHGEMPHSSSDIDDNRIRGELSPFKTHENGIGWVEVVRTSLGYV